MARTTYLTDIDRGYAEGGPNALKPRFGNNRSSEKGLTSPAQRLGQEESSLVRLKSRSRQMTSSLPPLSKPPASWLGQSRGLALLRTTLHPTHGKMVTPRDNNWCTWERQLIPEAIFGSYQ
ncbi:hypothetical protein RHMOL_Rhmol09G0243600 [Rhododendron molle]|uniref:Uncharacterized protein n=1 Tax=Rhododendron molle TaxID=49168 RepID=A0ACC0MI13_RHOML|nr:hypothetical protein RHMOL_Rhmol09G0243600 [Rhododendron molle]